MEDNIIYDCNSEKMYGFLIDFKKAFQNALDKVRETDNEIFVETIKDIDKLLEQDIDNQLYVYECWYNPMGAYIFTKLVRENQL